VNTEHCECYFWERKLISLVIAAICAASTYFLLEHHTNYTALVRGITASAVALASGVTSYVLNSESHCRFESLWGRKERATAPYRGDAEPVDEGTRGAP